MITVKYIECVNYKENNNIITVIYKMLFCSIIARLDASSQQSAVTILERVLLSFSQHTYQHLSSLSSLLRQLLVVLQPSVSRKFLESYAEKEASSLPLFRPQRWEHMFECVTPRVYLQGFDKHFNSSSFFQFVSAAIGPNRTTGIREGVAVQAICSMSRSADLDQLAPHTCLAVDKLLRTPSTSSRLYDVTSDLMGYLSIQIERAKASKSGAYASCPSSSSGGTAQSHSHTKIPPNVLGDAKIDSLIKTLQMTARALTGIMKLAQLNSLEVLESRKIIKVLLQLSEISGDVCSLCANYCKNTIATVDSLLQRDELCRDNKHAILDELERSMDVCVAACVLSLESLVSIAKNDFDQPDLQVVLLYSHGYKCF